MASTSAKRSRASAEQLSHMVDFMVSNPGLAGGKFKKLHGKLECDKKWTELSETLNSLGGAVKAVNQWQAVWKELKSRTSTKVRDRKRQQALTGNKPLTQEALSEIERRVISVIGNDYIEGHASVSENVPMEENLQLLIEDGEEIVVQSPLFTEEALDFQCDTPSTSKVTPRRGLKRKRAEDNKETKKEFLEIARKQADALKNIVVNETVFTFDIAFGPMVTQEEIFVTLIKPLVVNLKMGFNCTTLAYGQTGTGKSYTMGLNSKSFDGDDVGVIPRCLKEILSSVDVNSENKENFQNVMTSSQISVSFIEIYNEKVYDLLAENSNEPIVAKGYKYTGGTRKPLNSLEDCYTVLMQGNKNRHVRPTKMNSQSSRSHAIFTIHFLSRSQNLDGKETTITSCMNIVDLAGSEGVRRTGHQGVAMSEGVHINQGLLSIGKVLQAMATGSKVIPYRDSVLSSVLQESLNSNSYLTLLACISPHREDLSETLSTLRFAQNAKQLKHTPEINNIIADIKKTIKLKPTPANLKLMKINNTRTTPLKRSCYTLFGTQEKLSVKSNTFCTPKKQRMEVNKCNETEIPSNCKRAKMSNIAINLPKMNRLESTHNRESMFSRSLDSNGSLLSLNISTSTVVDGHASKRNTNLSPIIRKCMKELKNDLEENMLTMLQNKLDTLVPQTPSFAPNQTVLASTIRQELKNIMKEVLSEKNDNTFTKAELKQNQQTTISSTNTVAKCQLFTNSDELFKIPEVPLKFNGPKTSSPINKIVDSSASCIQTFFDDVTNSDNMVINKTIRRSYRISEKKQIEPSKMSLHDTALTSANLSLRRSSRKSVLQMYQNKRQSIRLATHSESLQEQKIVGNVKKSKKTSVNNTIINGYCNNSISTNKKTSLSKHRKAVLDLLNKGSMKELQILPQVGQKTAYQIVTQRTLNGKFKSLVQVEKLPIWRGTAWERFALANMLN